MTSYTEPLVERRVTRLPAHIPVGEHWRIVIPLARALFAAIFIMSGLRHFSRATIGFAAQQGVPLAEILVPVSGVVALAGGLCILLGFHTRLGAWLIVLFLVPVTFTMHQFWTLSDPAAVGVQQAMFMKNLAMLGGALMIAYFGGGLTSLDMRQRGR